MSDVSKFGGWRVGKSLYLRLSSIQNFTVDDLGWMLTQVRQNNVLSRADSTGDCLTDHSRSDDYDNVFHWDFLS